MARNVRYRTAQSIASIRTLEDVKDALASILYQQSEAIIEVSADYTTTGKVRREILIMNGDHTVTLHTPADDGDQVWIVADGNTASMVGTVEGATDPDIDTPQCLQYNEADDEWHSITLSDAQIAAGYVTLDTAQTILGEKTFSADILIQNSTPILRLRPIADTQQARLVYTDTAGNDDAAIVFDYDASPQVMNFAVGGLSTVDMSLDANGNLTVSSNLAMTSPAVPSSASDTGSVGTVSWDADYIYVCTATDTWKRAALSTW